MALARSSSRRPNGQGRRVSIPLLSLSRIESKIVIIEDDQGVTVDVTFFQARKTALKPFREYSSVIRGTPESRKISRITCRERIEKINPSRCYALRYRYYRRIPLRLPRTRERTSRRK